MTIDQLITMKRKDPCSPSVAIYLDRMQLGPIQQTRFIEALSEAGQGLAQYERAMKTLLKYTKKRGAK